MASKPILYSFHLSSCAWRVRIVLALKNLDYEYKTVKLMTPAGGDQYTEEFKKHNPMSQVPVLEVDGKSISQSVAIMEYLEETYPQPRLLPADPYLRAKTREITELLVSGVQPLQGPGLIPKLGKEEWQNWAQFYITKGFTALEAIVTETSGKYCVGDEITLADACLLPQPILYSWFPSSCPYRVRIALALKNVDYEYRSIKLLKEGGEPGDQMTPEFTEKNPMREVPVLEIDGETLSQSLAIIEYLEEKYPEPRLLPENIVLRAKVRAIAQLIASGIQPLQNVSVVFRVEKEKRASWTIHDVKKGFQALEAVLSKTAGKYCVGDSVTIADVCLVPQVDTAKDIKLDMTPYPTIVRINDALEELPAFKVAHPSRQPDAPDAEFKFAELLSKQPPQ